jgi:hypothetical protein
MSRLEVDLDDVAEPTRTDAAGSPVPRALATSARHPFRAALVTAGLVGVLTGTVLSSSSAPPAPALPSQQVAVMSLRSVVLAPRPSAVLQLSLENDGDVHQIADQVTISGGGLVGAPVQVGHDVPPQGRDDATLTVPLQCGPGQAGGAVSATVRLREVSTSPVLTTSDIPVVTVGKLAHAGAVCAAADDVLPYGWREQAHVVRWSLTGTTVDLTVSGLPSDVTDLVSVQADGVFLPAPSGTGAVRSGQLTVSLTPPSPGCRDGGVRPVAPTGLQLLVIGAGGMRYSYVPIGPPIAGWLMDAYVRACPSNPNGPSAVRTGFEG